LLKFYQDLYKLLGHLLIHGKSKFFPSKHAIIADNQNGDLIMSDEKPPFRGGFSSSTKEVYGGLGGIAPGIRLLILRRFLIES
jgi:hypothetical protein